MWIILENLKIKEVEIIFDRGYFGRVMKASLAVLLLVSTPHQLSVASVEQRLNQLESKVSEMQILLERLALPSSPRPAIAGKAKTSPGSYRIQPGDSFWSISRRHGLTVTQLLHANPGINPRRLSIGKVISLPGVSSPTGQMAAVKRSQTITHEIRKGDMMERIARRYGVSLSQLKSANPGVNPLRLKIGSTLQIPGQSPSGPLLPRPVETKSGLPEAPTPLPKRPVEKRDHPYLKALETTPPVVEATKPVVEEPKPIEKPQPIEEPKPVEEPEPGSLSEPRLIVLAEDTRFSAIANEHKTTVSMLNQLNQQNLKPGQMIKAGSQIYIPAP